MVCCGIVDTPYGETWICNALKNTSVSYHIVIVGCGPRRGIQIDSGVTELLHEID